MQDVMIDTGSIQDPQLVSIGEESRIGFDVKVAGAMLVPAGMLDPQEPALIFSPVRMGTAPAFLLQHFAFAVPRLQLHICVPLLA
jgi:hypothetical protein